MIDQRAFSKVKIVPPAPLPYVSRAALKRVTDNLPAPTECRYCQAAVVLSSNSAVYKREFGRWPYIYLCSGCGAYVGIHPDTDIPLGTLADASLRSARKTAKDKFMRVLKMVNMSRTKGYKWLAHEMGIDVSVCHFGWFELDDCLKASLICDKARITLY